MVTATVDDVILAYNILHVPLSIRHKIRGKTSTSADFREGVIEYYIQYSPYASWAGLAGDLYFSKCGEALAAARRFIKKTPGKCVYTRLEATMLKILPNILFCNSKMFSNYSLKFFRLFF